MGLILDSSVAIAAERRKAPVEDLLAEIRAVIGPTDIALSVVSVMELEHGIRRAQDASRAKRRRQFLEDLINTVPVYPLTVELARKAGRMDAEEGPSWKFRPEDRTITITESDFARAGIYETVLD